ncbi:hypothetical protein J3R83DRAFT_1202 [Lanmaoa asiatica]|nr:hypothetical protein J3R83DRAFT_1202 [Lanmaoa asiatica]
MNQADRTLKRYAYIALKRRLCIAWIFSLDSPSLVCEFMSYIHCVPDASDVFRVLPRFGLIDKRTNRWTTFVAEIKKLNTTAEPGVKFKVFFLGRHGEGYHNVGEAKYGPKVGCRTSGSNLSFDDAYDIFKAWCEYWAKLNGDGEIVWGPDPQLTPLGVQQAQEAHDAWEREHRFGIPLPEKLYTSPLTRAIRTNQMTFDDTLLPSGPKTIIVEVNLRILSAVIQVF